MKKYIALLAAGLLCLAGCAMVPEAPQTEVPSEPETTEQLPPETEESAAQAPEEADVELVGPWHLDGEKNDLSAFAEAYELFPGYGEWGAGMEIRSNGQMSWYIGAESWYGTYTREGAVLQADLSSGTEQRLWVFRITAQNGTAGLEMEYGDWTIYWAYGDQEDIPAMGADPVVYVDRQGTEDVYSTLSVTENINFYQIEMEIYRLGSFSGTAVETQGTISCTLDPWDITGTLTHDGTQAVFTVTESHTDLVTAGTVWAFPERLSQYL